MRVKAKKDLISLIREAKNNRTANWPLCLTCGREPHKVALEDVTRTKIVIRAWCTHIGNPTLEDPEFEDWIEIDIPFGAERDEHITWALRNGRFFNPAMPTK